MSGRVAIAMLMAACGYPKVTPTSTVDRRCIDDAIEHRRQIPPKQPPIKVTPIAESTPVPVEVEPALVEGHRISGARSVVPDEATRTWMARHAIIGITAEYRVCVDPRGVVQSVERMHSSCFPRYDEAVRVTLHTWRYAPYLVDDKPVDACTSVKLVYRQPVSGNAN